MVSNPNVRKVNFSSKTKKELSKINSVSGKKSEGAKKRWFRAKNPDIDALMRYYKTGDQMLVMEKYATDNEQFMELYKVAETPDEKRKILRDYQTFQFKIWELLIGTKSLNLNLNINKTDSAKNMEEIYELVKTKDGDKKKRKRDTDSSTDTEEC